MAFLYSLNKNVAARSFNLGMVNCLSGATFEVGYWSSQDIFLLLSVGRM